MWNIHHYKQKKKDVQIIPNNSIVKVVNFRSLSILSKSKLLSNLVISRHHRRIVSILCTVAVRLPRFPGS